MFISFLQLYFQICGLWVLSWLRYLHCALFFLGQGMLICMPYYMHTFYWCLWYSFLMLSANVDDSTQNFWALFGWYSFLTLCSEADEICKVCSVIGRPTQSSCAEGLQLARAIKYEFPQVWLFFLWASGKYSHFHTHTHPLT